MASSNPFEILAENHNGDIDQNYEEIDPNFEEMENFEFKSLVSDVKLEIPDGKIEESALQLKHSLLACSSTFGFLVIGNNSGFVLVQTEQLRATVLKTNKSERAPLPYFTEVKVKEGKVLVVSLSQDQLQVLVAVSSRQVLVYNVHDIVEKKNDVQPVQTIQFDDDITSIQSDSQAHPDLIAVGTGKNNCKIVQYMTNTILCSIPDSTCFCWSPFGDHIACGSNNGVVSVYDINGHHMNDIQPPTEMKMNKDEKVNRCVNGILWIEKDTFFIVYARPKNQDVEYEHTAYIVQTESQNGKEGYIPLEEITPIFNDDRPEPQFYYRVIRNYGPKMKTLIIVANSSTSNISAVRQSIDNDWSTIYLENELYSPLDDESNDTYPMGLAIDFSASEPLPPFDPSEDDTPVPPFPVLYFSNTDGVVCTYHIFDKSMARDGLKCPEMVDAKDFSEIPSPPPVEPIVKEQGTIESVPSATPVTADPSHNSSSASPSLGKDDDNKNENDEIPKLDDTSSDKSTAPSEVPQFGHYTGVTPFANLQTKPNVPSYGFNSDAFNKEVSFGFGGFKNVQMNTDNLFGAKSFVTQLPPSAPVFPPPAQDSKDGSSMKSAFNYVEKKDEPIDSDTNNTPPVVFAPSILNSKNDAPVKSAFGYVEKKDEPVHDSEEEKKNDSPAPAENTSREIENKDESINGLETKQISKKSSDDSCAISFEELKHTIEDEDDDGSSAITKISSIHEDDYQQSESSEASYGSSEVSSESSGFHITKDQLQDDNQPKEEDELAEESDIEQKEQEVEKTKEELEAEEAARKQAEEEERQRKEKEEADRKQAEEEERQRKEKEEAARKQAEEEERQRREKEEADRKQAEEEERQRKEKEEAARKQAEEEERQRREKEEAARKQAEEEERKRREKEEAARKLAEEEERKRKEREAEERRIAELARLEAERRERARLEAERLERERLEAIENTLFARRTKTDIVVKPKERSTGLHPLAAQFENAYFETEESLEWNHGMLENIQDTIEAYSKSSPAKLNLSALKNQEQLWKISDSEDISTITKTLIQQSTTAVTTLEKTDKKLEDFCTATDRLLARKDSIGKYIEESNFDEPLDIDIFEEYEVQYKQAQDKVHDVEIALESAEELLNEHKQSTDKPSKVTRTDNLNPTSLRRIVRDIDQSLKKQQNKLMSMEEQELKLSLSDSKSEKYMSQVSKRAEFLNAVYRGVQPNQVTF